MESLLIKIRQSYGALNENDRRIASFILEKQNDVLAFSINDLARKCETSQSAVVRFCKVMGLTGFKQFKQCLTADVIEQSRSDEELQEFGMDITGEEPIEDITHRVVNNNVCSIQDTQKLIDQKTLQKVIGRLSAAKRIDFYGVGASGLVALDACEKFIRIGKISNAWLDPHVQITMATTLKPEDVAVVISYSGATSDMLDMAGVIRDSGAFSVAITKFGCENLLSALTDETLFVASPEITLRSGALGSRMSQLMMIDILFLGVISLNPSKYREAIAKSYRYASERKRKSNVVNTTR